MKDNSHWFRHDFGARNDPKLMKLRRVQGMAGMGLFWNFTELLYEQGGRIAVANLADIAFEMRVDVEDIEHLVGDYGLFVRDEEYVRSLRADEEIAFAEEKSNKARASAMRRWENRSRKPEGDGSDANVEDKEYERNADVMRTQCEGDAVTRPDQTRPDQLMINLDSIDIESLSPSPQQDSAPRPKAESVEWVKDKFNAVCKDFPRVASLSEKRRNKIRLRLEEMRKVGDGETVLNTVFDKMQSSKFLKGDNPRGWKANFDWVFDNATNWVKIYEGNYDDRRAAPTVDRSTGFANYKNDDIWK